MAFGITRAELEEWKHAVAKGEIAFLTHYWIDERFPNCTTVTKVGCSDLDKLKKWGASHGLKPEWIDYKDKYPHYDLFAQTQKEILIKEKKDEHLQRFHL